MKKKTVVFMLMFMLLLNIAKAEWIDRTDPVDSGTVTASSQIGDFEGWEKAFDNSVYTKWLHGTKLV